MNVLASGNFDFRESECVSTGQYRVAILSCFSIHGHHICLCACTLTVACECWILGSEMRWGFLVRPSGSMYVGLGFLRLLAVGKAPMDGKL